MVQQTKSYNCFTELNDAPVEPMPATSKIKSESYLKSSRSLDFLPHIITLQQLHTVKTLMKVKIASLLEC